MTRRNGRKSFGFSLRYAFNVALFVEKGVPSSAINRTRSTSASVFNRDRCVTSVLLEDYFARNDVSRIRSELLERDKCQYRRKEGQKHVPSILRGIWPEPANEVGQWDCLALRIAMALCACA